MIIDRTGAQRVLAVLDEGIRDLQLLGSIPPISHEDERKLLARLSDRGLEHLVGPLHTQRQRERDLAALEVSEAFAASRTHQRRLLQQATRQLLAELHKAVAHQGPDAVEALDEAFQSAGSSSVTTSTEAQALLVQTLGKLKAVLAQRFRSTLQQDLHASTVLATMTERQRLAEAALGSLSAAYDANRAGTAKEVAALEDLKARLERELAEGTARMEAEMAAIAAEVEGAGATAAHEARKAALNQEIAAMIPKMNRRAEREAAEKAAWKARQAQAEAELAGLLAAYEQAVGEKQSQLTTLWVAVEVEAKELEELREHFDIVTLQQEERRQLEAARRAAAEATAAEEKAAAQRMLRSVVRIQAVYRGFKAWRAYKGAKTAGTGATTGEKAGKSGGGKKRGGAAGKKGGAGAGVGGVKKGKEKAGAAEKAKAPVTVKAPAKAAAAGAKKK